MNKDCFEIVAELLRNPPLGRAERRERAEQLADTFAKKNPRFNRELFLQASGVSL